MLDAVKPCFKGHSDERTPSDKGMFSQSDDLSFPCLGTCDVGTPVM